jgi:hypothetical protein
MKKDSLHKFFTACAGVTQLGQIAFKDDTATMTHSDLANVCVGHIIGTGFDVADGTFGLEFGRIVTLCNAIKSKEVEFTVSKDLISIRFEKTNKTFAPLNLDTLPTIRPNIMEKMEFPCKVDVDKNEFVDIISVIEKTTGIEKNSSCKIAVSYDGKNLSLKTMDDPRDYIERIFEIISTESGNGNIYASCFSFDYLLQFSSVFKKLESDTLTIGLGNDSPMVYTISDVDININYLLAPRIDTND